MKTKIRLILILLGIFLCFWGIPKLFSGNQVKQRHEALLQAIGKRDKGTLEKLVAANYQDDWNFDQKKIRLAMDDLTVQFLALEVVMTNPTWEISGDTATCRGSLMAKGSPATAIGAGIQSELSQNAREVSFIWTKTGWTPWSWQLTSIRVPGLEIPASYTPGELGNMSLEL